MCDKKKSVITALNSVGMKSFVKSCLPVVNFIFGKKLWTMSKTTLLTNLFWQLSLDTNWNSLCVYNVGR